MEIIVWFAMLVPLSVAWLCWMYINNPNGLSGSSEIYDDYYAEPSVAPEETRPCFEVCIVDAVSLTTRKVRTFLVSSDDVLEAIKLVIMIKGTFGEWDPNQFVIDIDNDSAQYNGWVFTGEFYDGIVSEVE